MRFRVEADHISHDRMQDEVIIINITSGAYYSGSGPAADCWTLLSTGASIEEAAQTLADEYGAELADVYKDLEAAAEKLAACGLLSILEAGGSVVAEVELPAVERSAWSSPTFDEYTDMWDLLQADPIHDVGEAGWPYAVPNKA